MLEQKYSYPKPTAINERTRSIISSADTLGRSICHQFW